MPGTNCLRQLSRSRSRLDSRGVAHPRETIDTTTVITVLRESGFTHLALFPGAKNPTQTSENLVGADWIYTPGYNPVEMPLSVVRLPSVTAAKKRYANDEPLLKGRLTPGEKNIVPPGFDASNLTEVRVCNVVLSSYNANRVRSLARRFHRAIAGLRTKC